MSRALVVSLALLLVGLVIGQANDRAPERVPEGRAGLRVLEVDLHAHTRFSDGFLSPFDVVLHAQRRGLDAVAVTEHNTLYPAKIARWFSERVGGPTVLPGEEVTSDRFHVIAVGLRDTVAPEDTAEGVIDAIHAQGGLAFAAHPVSRFWPSLLPAREKFDGAEIMHPLAYSDRPRPGWSWDEMRTFFVESKRPLTPVGSSDYHAFAPLGMCRTLVFAEDASEHAIIGALRQGKTVVYDPQGRAYGDPALVEALAREPYSPRPQAPYFAARGWLDAAGRTLGLLGAVGLVLLGRRRARSPAAVRDDEAVDEREEREKLKDRGEA